MAEVPYRKVRNKGELEKFYYSKTHEPIISREDFEAVQKIVKERKCPNKELIKNYPLSKKVYCGECGSLFKRRFSRKLPNKADTGTGILYSFHDNVQ